MKIDRILIRGTNWLGDAVMTTPALERLRASFPNAEITMLATPLTAGLFQASPFVNNVIEYRRREQGVKAFFATVAQIRAGRFDLAVLFQNAFEAALLAALGGARLRIGFAGQGRGALLTHRLHRGASDQNRHQIHDYLDIVAECERVCLGEDFRPAVAQPLPSLLANAAQRDAAAQLLHRFGLGSRPTVALNTAATNSRAKCWPADRFARLADRLTADLDAQIVLIGAASERANAEIVIQQMSQPGAVNLAGETTMAELIGLLAICSLLVTNDTGPAHVAAALGTPTLTIFGPTNEFETAPTGTQAELIRAEGIKCARCMYRDCPIDHRCMTRIAPEDVLAHARKLLGTIT
ncbi:MAG: lipopolysaccharide heptosyltransferase II [Acidobacteriota bacterium]